MKKVAAHQSRSREPLSSCWPANCPSIAAASLMLLEGVSPADSLGGWRKPIDPSRGPTVSRLFQVSSISHRSIESRIDLFLFIFVDSAAESRLGPSRPIRRWDTDANFEVTRPGNLPSQLKRSRGGDEAIRRNNKRAFSPICFPKKKKEKKRRIAPSDTKKCAASHFFEVNITTASSCSFVSSREEKIALHRRKIILKVSPPHTHTHTKNLSKRTRGCEGKSTKAKLGKFRALLTQEKPQKKNPAELC